MARLTLIQAVNQALLQEMEIDKTVIVMGEDVGKGRAPAACSEDRQTLHLYGFSG